MQRQTAESRAQGTPSPRYMKKNAETIDCKGVASGPLCTKSSELIENRSVRFAHNSQGILKRRATEKTESHGARKEDAEESTSMYHKVTSLSRKNERKNKKHKGFGCRGLDRGEKGRLRAQGVTFSRCR